MDATGGEMSFYRRRRSFFPLLTAAMLAMSPAVMAQQQPAAPAAKPAAPKPAAPAQAAPKPAAPAQAAPKPAAPAQAAPKPATGTPGGGAPTLLGQYGDWGAYSANPGGKKVCFALAKPNASATNPPNRPRDPAFLFVSTRPAEKVKEEISVIIGYPFKPNSDASAEIGTVNFAMYTQADGAWIKNAAEEARMVDAMRKGSDLVVKGESGRGTKTTDTFSLKGIDQALRRIAQECP
jgi:invasion associated locus B (IalB) protein